MTGGVDMDSRRVERILRNLIGKRARPRRGQPIEISIGEDSDAVAVTVATTGSGCVQARQVSCSTDSGVAIPSRSRLTGGTGWVSRSRHLEDRAMRHTWQPACGRSADARHPAAPPHGLQQPSLSSAAASSRFDEIARPKPVRP